MRLDVEGFLLEEMLCEGQQSWKAGELVPPPCQSEVKEEKHPRRLHGAKGELPSRGRASQEQRVSWAGLP